MSQIRIQRTSEIQEVLAYLQKKYHVLSEAEIIKVALSEKYDKEKSLQEKEKDEEAKIAWEHLKIEGKKLGDKLLAKKGLKRENMSEEDLYNLLVEPLNPHTHKHV